MSKSKAKKREVQQMNFEKNEQKIKDSGLLFVKKNRYLCPICGNSMRTSRKLLVKNPICRNCMMGQSFGEEATIEILKKYKIQYEKEKTFSGLKGVGNKSLRFDFYITGEKRKFILEIDGEQHSEKTDWGANTKEHDDIKNQFCKDKNIKLYRVCYKYGKIEKLKKDTMKILQSEFSYSILVACEECADGNRRMTDEEINKTLEKLKGKGKGKSSLPKDAIQLQNIEVGLEVIVKMLMWLAKNRLCENIVRGTIIKITEKAILLKNEEELWLPRSAIKIYKKI